MKTINLKNEYPGAYQTDYMIEVSDEIADYLASCHRLEHAQREQLRYNKVGEYSPDFIGFTSQRSVAQEVEIKILIETILYSIRYGLTTGKSSLRAYYFFIEEYTISEIAEMFCVDKSTVSKSIKCSRKALQNLLKDYI